MDWTFIHEAQTSREVEGMLPRLREAAHLDRSDPARLAILSDLTLLWVAIADAIGTPQGQRSQLAADLLEIARQGSASCAAAARNGGREPLEDCAKHLAALISAPMPAMRQ